MVHRDLALRNVLVFAPAPALLCKLADFGCKHDPSRLAAGLQADTRVVCLGA